MPNAHDDDDADFDADADFDLYEVLGDSNAGAYQRVEERTGPPLAYVAEKSRGAIPLEDGYDGTHEGSASVTSRIAYNGREEPVGRAERRIASPAANLTADAG